jgi:hypothetical protein
MTNEEIVEELLHEAEQLKLRIEVLDLATKIKEVSPNMSFLESLEHAMKHIKEHV